MTSKDCVRGSPAGTIALTPVAVLADDHNLIARARVTAERAGKRLDTENCYAFRFVDGMVADGAGLMMNTGTPRHVIVEMHGGLMLAAPVAPRVVLSLLAKCDADREKLGFELAQFTGLVNPHVAHIR